MKHFCVSAKKMTKHGGCIELPIINLSYVHVCSSRKNTLLVNEENVLILKLIYNKNKQSSAQLETSIKMIRLIRFALK